MNNPFVSNIIRIVLIILLQVLIIQRVDLRFGDFDYFNIFLYPIVILLFPLNVPRPIIVLLSFMCGFTVDIFYDSYGVHASACLLMGFLRKPILKQMEPTNGYNITSIPSLAYFDFGWITIFYSIMISVYMVMYFSMEAFSFVYIIDILLNTIFSFIITMLLIILYQLLFKPKV